MVRRRLGKNQCRRGAPSVTSFRGLDCLQMLSHGGQQAIAWYVRLGHKSPSSSCIGSNHNGRACSTPYLCLRPHGKLGTSKGHGETKQARSMRRETIFTNLRYPREAMDPTLCAASNAGTTRACSPFPPPHGPSRAEHDENSTRRNDRKGSTRAGDKWTG